MHLLELLWSLHLPRFSPHIDIKCKQCHLLKKRIIFANFSSQRQLVGRVKGTCFLLSKMQISDRETDAFSWSLVIAWSSSPATLTWFLRLSNWTVMVQAIFVCILLIMKMACIWTAQRMQKQYERDSNYFPYRPTVI